MTKSTTGETLVNVDFDGVFDGDWEEFAERVKNGILFMMQGECYNR